MSTRSANLDPPARELAAEVAAARLPSPAVRRRIRTKAGIGLREMARHLDVTPMTVQRWERGTSTPRRDRAIAYRRLLDELSEALG